MTSTKIVAYGTVDKAQFPDLEWNLINETTDPERQSYYKRYSFEATIPTSDPRFLNLFKMEINNDALTQEARERVHKQIRQVLVEGNNCALLFSK